MNQKTAKLIRRFIKNGNRDKNDVELEVMVEKFKTRYISMTSEERAEFKRRVK